MDSIEVRPIFPDNPDEATSALRLFDAVFQDTFGKPAPEFEKAVQGERIYLALMNGCVAGLAAVWDPDRFLHFLFVDSAARNRGAGSALVRFLAAQYGTPLSLKCLLENADAMAFYRATGWKEAETGLCEDGAYALLQYAP